ncbi:hypothetical protein KGEDBEEJ_02258 [Aeromonas hydrophila]
MSPMVQIIGYMSFMGLNLMGCLFLLEMLDAAGNAIEQWFTEWKNADISNHRSLTQTNKEGV